MRIYMYVVIDNENLYKEYKSLEKDYDELITVYRYSDFIKLKEYDADIAVSFDVKDFPIDGMLSILINNKIENPTGYRCHIKTDKQMDVFKTLASIVAPGVIALDSFDVSHLLTGRKFVDYKIFEGNVEEIKNQLSNYFIDDGCDYLLDLNGVGDLESIKNILSVIKSKNSNVLLGANEEDCVRLKILKMREVKKVW